MKDRKRETAPTPAAQFNLDSGGPAVSHRWIVNVLAQIIEYSEAHELTEVSRHLISAIEKISPVLIDPRNDVERADSKDRPGMSSDPSNVFYLHDPNYGYTE